MLLSDPPTELASDGDCFPGTYSLRRLKVTGASHHKSEHHSDAQNCADQVMALYRDVPITRYRILNRYALAAKPIQDMAVPITAAPPPSSGTAIGKKASAAAAKSEEDRSEFEQTLIDDRSRGGTRCCYTIHRI